MIGQFVEGQFAGGAGRLTLKRPPLNILNIAMLRELSDALDAAGGDTSLRVLVLRAEGTLFSAGVDVADHTADKVDEMIPLFGRVCAKLADFPAPTIAALHGHALGGGCELALCCDLVVAADTARLGQPEIKLATIAPVAAIRLTDFTGYRRAAELLFVGDAISAADAERIGLVNRVAPAAELDEAVNRLADQLLALSAPALRYCKRALRLGRAGWGALPAV